MSLLVAAFYVVPAFIILWVAFVGWFGLKFCWDTLIATSPQEFAEGSTASDAAGTHSHGGDR